MAAAAIALRADLVAAEVTEAFRGAGIRSILLRGPSIARHLYGAGDSRSYEDTDLLVAPVAMAAAEQILADHGFTHRAVLSQHPDDRPPWARTWKRADGGNVDLHRTIVGVGATPDETWKVLGERYTDRQRVEVVLTVAAYTSLAMYFNSTGGQMEPGHTGFPE